MTKEMWQLGNSLSDSKKSETERQLHVPLPHEKERRFTYLGVGKRTL